MTVTSSDYNALEKAFDFFNMVLFGGKLSHCLITLQRRDRTRGYYSPKRFSNRNTMATADEIALNPATFEGRSDEEILSTLVHEMVHQYQFAYGHPERERYHNKEWVEMMMVRGLMPTSTGKPGGKMTGQSVSHVIVDGGPFQLACRRLVKNGFKLNWESREPRKTKTGQVKSKAMQCKAKYRCLRCGQNAWAKPGARLVCGVCYVRTKKIVPMSEGHERKAR